VGSYFGLVGRIILTVTALCMPLFFITGWLLYLDRRRKKRQVRDARKGLGENHSDAPAWLIGFRQPERVCRATGLADRRPVAGRRACR
jgi:sulfite reductase (NADPH) flavoprotein alpha-component